MNAYRRNICLSLISVMLGGCVFPAHIDQDDPYTSARKKLLEDRKTKEYILALLDEPAAIYEQGSQWVYTASEIEWEVAAISPQAAGVQLFGKQHFLILNFDEQDVVRVYQFEFADAQPFRCTPSQYCHDGAGNVMRLADRGTESKVKEFPVSNNQCGVYLYGVGRTGRGNYTVTLNGARMGSVFMRPITFFYWNLNPGNHEIAVFPRPVVLSVNCNKNELIFVRFNPGFWSDKTSKLEIVEASKGRKLIKEKIQRLILAESGRYEVKP